MSYNRDYELFYLLGIVAFVAGLAFGVLLGASFGVNAIAGIVPTVTVLASLSVYMKRGKKK